MVKFNFHSVEGNPILNEIKVHLEKKPNEEPYIHQAILKLNAAEALKLIDQLKIAVIKITESK